MKFSLPLIGGSIAFIAFQNIDRVMLARYVSLEDSISGFEAIVKGDNMQTPGIPESFNVLIHELRGLALEITMK